MSIFSISVHLVMEFSKLYLYSQLEDPSILKYLRD